LDVIDARYFAETGYRDAWRRFDASRASFTT